MSGIFGIIVNNKARYTDKSIRKILTTLADYSMSRGKEFSGVVFRNGANSTIDVVKGDVSVKSLVKNSSFKTILEQNLESYRQGKGFCALGCVDILTNRFPYGEANIQPIISNNVVVANAGTIVNSDLLWKKNPDLLRSGNNEMEIIASLIRREFLTNTNLLGINNKVFGELEGTYNVGIMFPDFSHFILATNNGSLYYFTDNNGFIIFASERYFLEQLRINSYFPYLDTQLEATQLTSNNGIVVNIDDFKIFHFNSFDSNKVITLLPVKPFKINQHLIQNKNNEQNSQNVPSLNLMKEKSFAKLLEYNIDSIRKLKRCTKCLLPETFPFIEYDENGECNYCKNYKKRHLSISFNELGKLIEPYRKQNNKPDCIVPFSGGRDSTYSLHIVKKELGLNPIAFTYDWGMVTDLARRNAAKVCGKLQVENVVVAANIKAKMENIRRNILAWLKTPELGMIPLFMAGDKFFFYYCNQVKKQTGIDLNIWGVNNLENTDFKTGFAGISPSFNKKTIYSLSTNNKLKLFSFVGKNLIQSPGYFNKSMLDSLGSYAARYIAPKKDYYHLFDYYQWDENEVNNLILNEYDWEMAKDTKSTWRIGDGTASFYNYIYYTVAGFSEFDTFRSNQIREGMLDRETALKLCEEENSPRYESLQWYLETIGLDFERVIKVINSIEKLY